MRAILFVASLAAALGIASAASAQLYWLDTFYGAPTINRATADGVALASVALPAGSLPEGLAVDATGKVYWAEASWSNAKVNRAAPTLASITPLVTDGSVLRGVAVDNVAQQIYWTSSNLATGAAVHRAAFDGSGAAPLVVLALGVNPRGIAVDRTGGVIYWTDFDNNVIYRSNLSGSQVIVWLALGANTGPYGIAVDSQAQRVYWTEYISGTIRSVSTGLTNFHTPVSGLVNPTYLALDAAGARMYWSEGGVGIQRIRRASLSGSNLVTLPCPLTTYGGLAFQPNGTVSVPEIAVPSPTEFALERPWPNPASGSTRVRFSLPQETHVRLSVYDLQGREVAVLADGVMAAGRHEQTWSARASRVAVPAGIYFVRLAAAGRAWVQRVVLTP